MCGCQQAFFSRRDSVSFPLSLALSRVGDGASDFGPNTGYLSLLCGSGCRERPQGAWATGTRLKTLPVRIFVSGVAVFVVMERRKMFFLKGMRVCQDGAECSSTKECKFYTRVFFLSVFGVCWEERKGWTARDGAGTAPLGPRVYRSLM